MSPGPLFPMDQRAIRHPYLGLTEYVAARASTWGNKQEGSHLQRLLGSLIHPLGEIHASLARLRSVYLTGAICHFNQVPDKKGVGGETSLHDGIIKPWITKEQKELPY